MNVALSGGSSRILVAIFLMSFLKRNDVPVITSSLFLFASHFILSSGSVEVATSVKITLFPMPVPIDRMQQSCAEAPFVIASTNPARTGLLKPETAPSQNHEVLR